jgi:hypothetical protein
MTDFHGTWSVSQRSYDEETIDPFAMRNRSKSAKIDTVVPGVPMLRILWQMGRIYQANVEISSHNGPVLDTIARGLRDLESLGHFATQKPPKTVT